MRIDINTAQEMIQQYTIGHGNIIKQYYAPFNQNANPAVQDSRSVWFSCEELSSFLKAIQAAGGNGIRFYFGEYTNETIPAITDLDNLSSANCDLNQTDLADRITNLSQCVPNMQTLVMIPTNRVGGVDRDFNIVSSSNDFSNPTDLTAEDHGGMVPPPADFNGNYNALCGAMFLDIVDEFLNINTEKQP